MAEPMSAQSEPNGTAPKQHTNLKNGARSGGNITREERRARVMKELENVDIIVAEEALRLARNSKTPPSVKAQSLQILADYKAKAADGDGQTEALRWLRTRLDELEAYLKGMKGHGA